MSRYVAPARGSAECSAVQEQREGAGPRLPQELVALLVVAYHNIASNLQQLSEYQSATEWCEQVAIRCWRPAADGVRRGSPSRSDICLQTTSCLRSWLR